MTRLPALAIVNGHLRLMVETQRGVRIRKLTLTETQAIADLIPTLERLALPPRGNRADATDVSR